MSACEVSTDAVRIHLEKVLASRGFTGNPRLSYFLRYLVERRLEEKAGELKESLLGVEVFGRKPGFDTKQDSVVRTEAARLRTRLNQYYAADGSSDRLQIELPKGGYVPVFRQLEAVTGHAPAVGQDPNPAREWNVPRWVIPGAIVVGLTLSLVWWARKDAPGARHSASAELEKAYQAGITLVRERSLRSAHRGADELRRVMQADPRFAQAWAGLAEAAISLQPADPEAGLDMARRSVELDPQCGVCQGTLGFLLFSRLWQWDEAGERLKLAAALAPDDPQIPYWVADRHIALGQTAQALQVIDDAMRRMPHALNLHVLRALCLYMSRDFEGSILAADRAISVNLPGGWGWRSQALFQLGRYEEAVQSQTFHLSAWTAATAEQISQRAATTAQRYKEAGLQGPIKDLLDLTASPVAAKVHAHNRARWFLLLGKQDDGMKELEVALKVRLYDLIYLQVDPIYDPIRTRPAFQDALKTVGLAR